MTRKGHDAIAPRFSSYRLIDHSPQGYLVFPKTEFAEYFNHNKQPDQMTHGIICFVYT